jgi:hypothetical protein
MAGSCWAGHRLAAVLTRCDVLRRKTVLSTLMIVLRAEDSIMECLFSIDNGKLLWKVDAVACCCSS